MRTVGIRDLALGLGTVHAARTGTTPDVRRWLTAGLLSDALDVAAGLAAAPITGVRGVISSLVAAPVVVADLWALNLLRAQDRGTATRRSRGEG